MMPITPDFNIMPLGKEHILSIARLEEECFPDPWSISSLRSCFDSGALFLGAFSGGILIGYGAAIFVADYGDIISIAVSESFRRKGVGRALLRALINEARRRGVANFTLEVRKSNLAAIGLYESCGFRVAGIRKEYYTDNKEDALLMALSLSEGSKNN